MLSYDDLAPRDRRDPSWRDLHQLALALSSVPVMQSDVSRQQVLSMLPPAVAGSTPRHASTLIDIYGVLRTCLDHPGSLTALIIAVRVFSGDDSITVRQVEALMAELGLDGA